jgi:hypothetical protein
MSASRKVGGVLTAAGLQNAGWFGEVLSYANI